MKSYADRIRHHLEKKDINAAKTLLHEFKKQSFETRLEVLTLLALADDQSAFESLSFLMDGRNRDPEIQGRIVQLITDRAHMNFAFAVILFNNLEQTELKKFVPLIRHILSNETDSGILAATLKTAGDLAVDTLVDDIADFILYNDTNLKELAVKALEKTGSGLALKRLEKAAATSKRDRNILDAIRHIQSKNSPDPGFEKSSPSYENNVNTRIQELQASSVKERFRAFCHLSKGDEDTRAVLQKCLASTDTDLVVTALEIVSQSHPSGLVNDIFTLVSRNGSAPSVKFAAYEALETLPELESAAFALKGIQEPLHHVSMAAARALDKNLSDYTGAAVKDLIESGTRQSARIAETLLDAHAGNLIEYLMISDTFSYIAFNHLANRASFAALETYIKVLNKRNLKSTVKKYKDMLAEKNLSDRPVCFAVSPSGARLAVYDRLIFQAGYRPVLFQSRQNALKAVIRNKPQAVISDLFLKDITGTDFTEMIRQTYTKRSLPVILCTLQKSLSGREHFITDFPPAPELMKNLVREQTGS